MGSFSKKGNFLNLIEGFSKYYKYHRMIKNEKTLTAPKLASFSKSVFEEIQSMLSETTHGIILKDFGTIVPRDTMIEYNNGRFKKSIKIKNKYFFIFHKEWLSDYYRCCLLSNKKSKSKMYILREPKPYTINLHRKKLKND